MEEAEVRPAARLLCAARLGKERFGIRPEGCRPQSEAEGYRIQDALHAALVAAGQGPAVGHKIGCTTAVMQRFLAIDNPCAGGVMAAGLQHRDGRFRHGDFLRVGVECEIAVTLASDLPAAGTPYERDEVADAVGACMAAIEVVDDRYDDYRALDAATLIADDFFLAGCVLGEPVTDWRALDLPAAAGRMTIYGQEVGQGRGGDVLGHPLNALAWLANLRAAQGRPLCAGALVLLGSVVETKWLARGDRVEIAIEGLGTATAAFD
jgi:2-oxo-3-hexenedioate decarboxylase/2-keto-4-pentenoate hydratase